MDEEKKPSSADQPLEYWHSSERTPTALKLALSFFGGFLASFVIIIVLVGIFLGGMIDPKPGEGRGWARAIATICAACFIASIIGVFEYIRDQRELPFEPGRQSHRFFELGMLIGFGVAALLEGICFGAASFSA